MWTRLLDVLKIANNKIIQHQERRVAYWQLINMTNEQLKDIGITRGEISKKINR